MDTNNQGQLVARHTTPTTLQTTNGAEREREYTAWKSAEQEVVDDLCEAFAYELEGAVRFMYEVEKKLEV